MKKLLSVKVLLIVLASLFAVLLTYTQASEELEASTEDSLYQRPGVIPDDIKIIRIDEETLDKLGPYSDWDRSYFAELINILNADSECTPRVIGLDIIFTGTKNSEGDKAFVDAVSKAGNVVVTSKLEIDGRVAKNGTDNYYIEPFVRSEVKPFDALAAVSHYGFSNPVMDSDGYIRRAYGTLCSDGADYKSFAYKIAELAYGSENLKIKDAQFGFGYTGKPGEFEAISMSDVLNGEVGAEYFEDCVVLVGAYEEGLMDAYNTPVKHGKSMYGVEIQANIIQAIHNGKKLTKVNNTVQMIIAFAVILLFAGLIYSGSLKGSFIKLGILLVLYLTSVFVLFSFTGYMLYILYIPVSAVVCVLSFMIYRYVALQKHRAIEMQKTLFSMADSMAEAIEGRTPYNASHTKNVAKRSIEMLEYINKLHKEGKSELYFSKADKDQLYLAAMLHDIGKMDVPTIVMDKPTKLGALEEPLRARMKELKLRLEVACLKNQLPKEEYTEKTSMIDTFVDSLGGLNCGRPLKDEEKELINKMKAAEYIAEEGEIIPYLTQEEYDDLMIKAGTLTENERTIMQSHVVHTDKILSHVYFGETYKDVRAMASNHHELLNGKGYPNKLNAEQIDTMTRILTIMDIYDSLIADDRPYKKPKPVPVAFKILDEECEAGKIDPDLLEIAKQIWLTDDNN